MLMLLSTFCDSNKLHSREADASFVANSVIVGEVEHTIDASRSVQREVDVLWSQKRNTTVLRLHQSLPTFADDYCIKP